MQNGKNMFKTITKFLLVLLLVGVSLSVLPNQKVQAATQYGVLFASFTGEYEENGEGQTVLMPTEHETQYVERGKTATRPTDPKRDGYIFDNWYTDNTYSTLFNFSAPIYESKVVYGRWLKSIDFKAYDESTGNTGGGKITISGSFPGTSAPQVGSSASFTQNMFDSSNYTFAAAPDNGYYFKGWSFNSPSNGPVSYGTFTISPMGLSSQHGVINTLYAVFGKMGTETASWNAYEGAISNFRREYSVSGAGVPANGLYVLEDNHNITETKWEGLTADGKLPASGNAKFIITLKGNPSVGSYPVVFYDNVSNKIINVTITIKHRVQKRLPLAATCTTTGYNTYWECLECGKCFSDEACTVETTKEAMKVPALGHNYGSWQSLNDTQHRHYCSHDDSHYETRSHSWDSGVITTQPTTTAEGVKTYTCTGCGGTKTESIPKLENVFTVKYHETDASEASILETEVVYGVLTKTKMLSELDFNTDGRLFQGWKMYREFDNKWYIMKSNGSKVWATSLPAGGEYVLCKEGTTVKAATPAGSILHLYAQWKSTNTFEVRYHENDTAVASNIKTEVVYGVLTKTAMLNELSFNTSGKEFLGWRMYRESDNKWYVMTSNGSKVWATSLPAGGEYVLCKEGTTVKAATPAGSILHLYAQWKSTNTFEVRYHENDTAVASNIKTEVVYGVLTKTAMLNELNFNTSGRIFQGWKMYRESDNKWYVMTSNGSKVWATSLPAGGEYVLCKEGTTVKAATPAGSILHLYAQWEPANP